MNQWSRARKRLILSIILFVVIVLLGVPIFFLFLRSPSCTDGKRNGDETGVDCGGSCQRLCVPESLPLILKGDPRVLSIATSTYEVIALLENPNVDAELRRAHYIFKFFDATSLIPLKTIQGETFVPKGATFAVFEGPFAFDSGSVPVRATLDWEEASLVWVKNGKKEPQLVVKNPELTKLESSPRLDATISNLSLETVSNIDLVALISDSNGNIIAATKTFLDRLAPSAEAQAVFTWPRPFTATPAEVEVITRILPDRSYLR